MNRASATRSTATDTPLRCGRAFGLAVSADMPVIGLRPSESVPGPSTCVQKVSRRQLDELWVDQTSERLQSSRAPDGSDQVGVEHQPGVGFRISYPRWGRYVVSECGSRIRCSPPSVVSWRWQRLLTSQLLPIAAILQGYEALHASAVRVGERGVAFSAPSGWGKSSLAVQLMLRGADFIADDVVTIAKAGAGVAMQPGAACLNLRFSEARRLGSDDRRRLGAVVGRGADAARVELRDAPTQPCAMDGLYLLQRQRKDGELRFERLAGAGPVLFSTVYNSIVRTPQRLVTQLELLSRIAQATPVFRVHVPPSVDANRLAARIERHVATELG